MLFYTRFSVVFSTFILCLLLLWKRFMLFYNCVFRLVFFCHFMKLRFCILWTCFAMCFCYVVFYVYFKFFAMLVPTSKTTHRFHMFLRLSLGVFIYVVKQCSVSSFLPSNTVLKCFAMFCHRNQNYVGLHIFVDVFLFQNQHYDLRCFWLFLLHCMFVLLF